MTVKNSTVVVIPAAKVLKNKEVVCKNNNTEKIRVRQKS